MAFSPCLVFFVNTTPISPPIQEWRGLLESEVRGQGVLKELELKQPFKGKELSILMCMAAGHTQPLMEDRSSSIFLKRGTHSYVTSQALVFYPNELKTLHIGNYSSYIHDGLTWKQPGCLAGELVQDSDIRSRKKPVMNTPGRSPRAT